jgi:hypothetical protein
MSTRHRFVAVIVLGGVLATALVGCKGSSDQARSSSTPSSSRPRVTSTTPTSTSTTSTPSTTVASPAQGPIANPWPTVGPAPAGHHAILTVGDSIMGQGAAALPEVLKSHGFDAVVYDGHVNASGLLDPLNGVSAREHLAQQLAAHPDVDTVLFEWLNVCAFACSDGGLAYGSPEFYAAWQDGVRGLVDDARARNLTVLWVIPPPPPPPSTTDAPIASWSSPPMRVVVATQLAAAVRQYPVTLGVDTVDWWTALSDLDSQYQRELWYDGALHEVRSDDGVHITGDGSVRTSTWTVAALSEVYSR